MKVYFDERFFETYCGDPAAVPGRLEEAFYLLKEKYPLVAPAPCTQDDVLLVHDLQHLEYVRRDERVYPVAMLAAGATIGAAESSLRGEAAFALCRPPGHHASPASCWGFCYFNNIAIAVRKILAAEKVKKVLIVDFDLHYGDGTANTFVGAADVLYYHVKGSNRRVFSHNLREYLQGATAEVVAVSAGFDRHNEDWGGYLSTADYGETGKILGAFAREKCHGRIFAALEGGYNPKAMGEAIVAFLAGLEEGLQEQGEDTFVSPSK